jgi:hypothetical protein
VRRPDLSPAEQLTAAFRLHGELHGHDHRDVLDYALLMGALNDAETARVGPDGVPVDFVLAEVVPPWWRRLFGRRGYAPA